MPAAPAPTTDPKRATRRSAQTIAVAAACWGVATVLVLCVPLALSVSGVTEQSPALSALRDAALAASLALAGVALTSVTAALAFGDRVLLAAAGGRIASPSSAPRLHAAVDRGAARLRIARPAVATAPLPDALLVAGYSTGRTLLCADPARIRALSDEQLDALVTRELTLIASGDVRPMTVAAVLSGGAGVLLRAVRPGTAGHRALLPPGARLIARAGADATRSARADRAAQIVLGSAEPLAQARAQLRVMDDIDEAPTAAPQPARYSA